MKKPLEIISEMSSSIQNENKWLEPSKDIEGTSEIVVSQTDSLTIRRRRDSNPRFGFPNTVSPGLRTRPTMRLLQSLFFRTQNAP